MGLSTKQQQIDWLQRYIILHSYIYYELDNNLVEDRVYDLKAKELVKLKNENPDLWRSSEYYQQFGDDYNGATGFTLYHDLNDRQKEIIRSLVPRGLRKKGERNDRR